MSKETKQVETKTSSTKGNGESITFPETKKGRHISHLMNFLRIVPLPFFRLIKPFRYYGPRKVADGACVYICNHYTMLDPVYVMATTSEAVHFVYKKSLMNKPLISWLLRKLKCIPASRDGKDVRTMLECFKCLKNGEKVCVFPEGTRNKEEVDMLPFKHGAAVMAIRTKTPIVPMLLYKKPRCFRMTHVIIGEPFELSEYYDKKLTDAEYLELDDKLRDMLLQMREEHTQYLQSKKKKVK